MTRPAADGLLGLKPVAAMEAFKGLLVLLAGLGAFALLHRDVRAEAGLRAGQRPPARRSSRTGTRTVNVEPFPASLSTSSEPRITSQ